jgi:hypothetical protein
MSECRLFEKDRRLRIPRGYTLGEEDPAARDAETN